MNSTTRGQPVSHLGKHRTSKPTTINRRLGATENIYYLLDQLYCLNFIIFVEITGSLQIDQIKNSIDTPQQMILRNVVLKIERVEQPLLSPCMLPHHLEALRQCTARSDTSRTRRFNSQRSFSAELDR